jgi:hypothetical protein
MYYISFYIFYKEKLFESDTNDLPELKDQLARVLKLHDEDLSVGFAGVLMDDDALHPLCAVQDRE